MQKINSNFLLLLFGGIVGLITNSFFISCFNFITKLKDGNINEKNTLYNLILSAIIGVSTAYSLIATGRKQTVFKGMGNGFLYWFLFKLPLSYNNVRFTKRKYKVKPMTKLLGLINLSITGIVSAIMTARMGEDTLFPYQLPSRKRLFSKDGPTITILKKKLDQMLPNKLQKVS